VISILIGDCSQVLDSNTFVPFAVFVVNPTAP